MHNHFTKYSHSSFMFRHNCVILRDFVVGTMPSYTIMSNEFVGGNNNNNNKYR